MHTHYTILKVSEASVDFGTFGKEALKSVTCGYQGSVVSHYDHFRK